MPKEHSRFRRPPSATHWEPAARMDSRRRNHDGRPRFRTS
jgi:hypothetical protein